MCPYCRSLLLADEYEDSRYCWICDEGDLLILDPDELDFSQEEEEWTL